MAERPPLNWEASANPTNSTISDTLPPEVVACFRNARFLHLATSSPTAEPHISLMSHTYLPSTPWTPGPTIIMTTNPSSRKTAHLASNPRVALLVHDWVSPRTDGGGGGGGGSSSSDPPASGQPHDRQQPSDATSPAAPADRAAERRRPSSSLASMLLGFNRAELGRISATVSGAARILARGGAEERWCRARHVANHGFKGQAVDDEEEDGKEGAGDEGGQAGNEGGQAGPGEAAGARYGVDVAEEGFLQGEDVRVVVVRVREGRIADWRGGVTDFVIRGADGGAAGGANGVV